MFDAGVLEKEDRPDLVRSFAFFAANIAGIVLPFVFGWSWTAIIFCVLFYFSRMFTVVAFLHRYWCHKAFKPAKKAPRKTQFAMALATNSCLQRGPLWWAAHHRAHHRHSDKEGDPHSTLKFGTGTFGRRLLGAIWAHILWLTTRKGGETDARLLRDFIREDGSYIYPELRFTEHPLGRLVVPMLLLLAAFLFGHFCGDWLGAHWGKCWGTSGMQMFAWYWTSTFLLYHGTFSINSAAHLFGTQPFPETGDRSRNNLFLAIITLGEGWHNNHHHEQWKVNQGQTRFQLVFDWAYWGIFLLHLARFLEMNEKTLPKNVWKKPPAQ